MNLSNHPLQNAVRESGIQVDSGQTHALTALMHCYDQLILADQSTTFLSRVIDRLRPRETIHGVYIWGSVGRGKTHLCDLFFESLPLENKQRLHFHNFMRLVHSLLHKFKNQQNPLHEVAASIAQQGRVLCLDEMQITDITDAMLIHGLLQGLIANNVSLITTSNLAPKNLYKNGLQRDRFLPAITLIEQHTQVIHLGSGTDYRLRTLTQAQIYHTPLTQNTNQLLDKNFHDIVAIDHPSSEALVINDRPIECVKWAEDAVWFEFDVICNSPRSKNDYIEIACLFHTVLIANIAQLDDQHNDPARRLIEMIDSLYDRNVKLIISAASAIEQLYTGKRLAFEFKRSISRLREMQSHDYLAKPHLA